MGYMFESFRAFLFATFTAFIGYFSPIHDIIHVMVAAIFFDLIIGLWAARKQGHGWKSIKMWRTVEKMFLAVVIVFLLFAMDQEMGFEMVQFHRFAALLITGFEIWSILENATKISNHKIFDLLRRMMRDKIEDHTGIDVAKNNES